MTRKSRTRSNQVGLGRTSPIVLLLLVAWPATVHAYLDPASGSILLQVILGGVAGAGLLIKLTWHRLRSLIGLRRTDDDAVEP